jgi:hypothetical protein
MNMIQQHRLLARPGLQKDFKDTYEMWPDVRSQYLKVGTVDTPEISMTTIAGPSRLIQSRELEPVAYQEVVTGPKIVAVDKTYKGGYFLSKEAIDDDQYGKLNQGAKWLAEAVQYTKEYTACALVDDAFTGTTFKAQDNLSLCNTAHTLINSSATSSNRPTTAVSLSVAGFTALMDLARKVKNQNGDPMLANPDMLMLANDQGQINKAYQILESTLEPFTANNQDNPIRRNFKPTKIIINPYMANLFHYFVIDSRLNDAWFRDKEKVSMRDWYDEEVDAAKVKARGRWMIYVNDWRGWYGTNPSA